ncbi:MAG: NuoM family protein, partial [Candidatus Zixiibacteriota bacterium]
MFDTQALSWLIFLPTFGALALPLARSDRAARVLTLVITALTMLLSFWLYGAFIDGSSNMQFEVNLPWAPDLGIYYHLGVDGLSLLLIVLTTVLTFLATLSSWKSVTTSVRGYYASMLLLLTGMVGVFASLDLFLFYVFWEVMLIPMYFLIGLWGGPRRIYASIKFVLFTMFGSLLMLVALLYLYFEYHAQTGVYSFDLISMYDLNIPGGPQAWLFLAFGLAFAIKIPI